MILSKLMMVSRKSVARARQVLRRLRRAYPVAACPFPRRTPFRLLVAIVLSAQTTDAKVLAVLPALWSRYPSARALAAARLGTLERILRPLGLFRSKARNLVAFARMTGGRVPASMEELVRLPGVGRKTANLVLGEAFGRFEGIAIDTHCRRLARRLGLSSSPDVRVIERDLMCQLPRRDWGAANHLLIAHGRAVCRARRPLCTRCLLLALCPSAGRT